MIALIKNPKYRLYVPPVSGADLIYDFTDPEATARTSTSIDSVTSRGSIATACSQATSSRKPTWPGATTLNGYNTASFDGGDWLDGTISIQTAEVTFFAVVNRSVVNSVHRIFGTQTANTGVQFTGTSSARLQVKVDGAAVVQGTTNMSANTWYVCGGRFSDSNNVASVTLNGGSVESATENTVPSSANLTLGGQNGTNLFGGSQAILIRYSSYLSDSDYDLVRNSLGARFAIF